MAVLCDMHSLMPVGFFHVFITNDFFTWMFICCCWNLIMFYDWRECVMGVLDTTKHS